MNTKSKFTDEFCAWVSQLGRDARVRLGTSGIFDEVDVFFEGTIQLVFTLVELRRWVERGMNPAPVKDCSGVRHIVLWEDDWNARNPIVCSRIASLLGISQKIPARLTTARRIDKALAGKFLADNHLQGVASSKSQYGLFLPERYYRVLNRDFVTELPEFELLVAVATFSHPRIFKRNQEPYRSYELIRFTSLLNSTVTGGLSKLISAFVKDFDPGDIMTYADLEWSEGTSYSKMGFEAVSDTPPIHFWLDPVSEIRFNSKISVEQQQGKVPVQNLGSRKFVKDYLSTGGAEIIQN